MHENSLAQRACERPRVSPKENHHHEALLRKHRKTWLPLHHQSQEGSRYGAEDHQGPPHNDREIPPTPNSPQPSAIIFRKTKGHVAKVEGLLRQVTGDASTSTCKAISSLITEAEDNIKDAGDESIRDITLIASAQQVEHHDRAVYGTLRTWAELLGDNTAAETLESILDEEKAADETLTAISDTVNTSAEPTKQSPHTANFTKRKKAASSQQEDAAFPYRTLINHSEEPPSD